MFEIVSPDIDRYAEEHTSPEPAFLTALAEETRASTAAPQMMVGALEGRFLQFLVYAVQPRLVVEIGTFTGYSALSMAAALPPDGTIVTCELDPERAAVARRHFDASPWARQIELRLGPALDSIAGLRGPFDLIFIDADKTNYANYYEVVLPKLSPRGVIAVDNTLWGGAVLNDDDKSDDSVAIRAFNDMVIADERVVCVQLTVRDGVTLIRRRDGAPGSSS